MAAWQVRQHRHFELGEFIGLTLLYFRMAVIQLFPETKMADARKQSVLGTHCPGEPRSQCSKLHPPLQFRPAFLEPTPWQEFSINTLIFQHSLSFSHFHLQGQHTLSSVTSRENTITLSFQSTAVYRHKNVYATQPFSYLLHLFGEIFFQLQKQQKFRQTTERKKETTWEKTRSS